MSFLHPMREVHFEAFATLAAENYARDNVASGRWAESDALNFARGETRALLPDGIRTTGHRLFEIIPPQVATTVGYLWLSSLQRGSIAVTYVYQILVLPPFRRQGFARAALLEAEALARQEGHRSIGLTVFASNASAQALYASVGYRPMNFSLNKDLP